MYRNSKKNVLYFYETSQRRTPIDEYDNFITTHIEAAAEYILLWDRYLPINGLFQILY